MTLIMNSTQIKKWESEKHIQIKEYMAENIFAQDQIELVLDVVHKFFSNTCTECRYVGPCIKNTKNKYFKIAQDSLAKTPSKFNSQIWESDKIVQIRQWMQKKEPHKHCDLELILKMVELFFDPVCIECISIVPIEMKKKETIESMNGPTENKNVLKE